MRKLAMIQHPMWLIIKEDSLSAEATPPWGAVNLDDYSERISRNLAIIENNPNVKLNYEFSGFELEDLVVQYPMIYQRMLKMVTAGRLFFVNGTYSQGHGHVLSLEANIRQFEYGLEVLRKLFNVNILSHAVQEPDYTNQTPQLLRAFGMKFACCGAFIHDLITPMGADSAPSLQYRWVGLDGSWVGLTPQGVSATKGQTLIDEDGIGINLDRREPAQLRDEPLFVLSRSPDLQEFDVDPNYEYVSLDEALEEQYRDCPPKVDTKIQLPWSYVEGTDGETLLWELAHCEEELIRLETLASLLDEEFSATSLDPLWKKWLQSQHHDALWAGGPELREKSRQWCRQTKQQAREKLLDILGAAGKEGSCTLCLITDYPLSHEGVLRIPCLKAVPEKLIGADKQILVQISTDDELGSELLIPYSAKGCVQETFVVEGTGKEPEKQIVTEKFTYSNNFYSTEVSPYGGLERICTLDGIELFRNSATVPRDYTVEGLRKQAAMGITRKRLIGMGMTDLEKIHYQYGLDAAGSLTAMIDGKLEAYALSSYRSELARGPVADVLTSQGSVGPIPVTRKTYLYHELPWIEMEINCKFEETEIDSFPEDAHKLCIWWPSWYRDLITSAIPGGCEVPSRPEIAFFPASWFDMDHVGANGGGLAVAYENAYKTFRRNGRIGTVLAWGDKDGHFHNHNEALKWRTQLDLRLRGNRTYRFFLFPHGRDWRDDQVASWAMARQRSPLALWERSSSPSKQPLLHLDADGIVPTSVARRDGSLKVCFYEGCGRDATVKGATLGGKAAKIQLKGLDQKPLERITNFKIGEIEIAY